MYNSIIFILHVETIDQMFLAL